MQLSERHKINEDTEVFPLSLSWATYVNKQFPWESSFVQPSGKQLTALKQSDSLHSIIQQFQGTYKGVKLYENGHHDRDLKAVLVSTGWTDQ